MVADRPLVTIDCRSTQWSETVQERLNSRKQVILLHFSSTPSNAAELDLLAEKFDLKVTFAWGSVVLKPRQERPVKSASRENAKTRQNSGLTP
jgi:hypothetical protein